MVTGSVVSCWKLTDSSKSRLFAIVSGGVEVVFYLGHHGDIALPNVRYEMEWQLQKKNKTYLEEVEKLKKEVMLEGLQVEEEGMPSYLLERSEAPPGGEDKKEVQDEKGKEEASPGKRREVPRRRGVARGASRRRQRKRGEGGAGRRPKGSGENSRHNRRQDNKNRYCN
ncbi:hypothetical protein AAG570_004239 [Ranatra chinensis]|uniref:Uncharacterized protein n=1 Tax=Ranatra chinensis TaxID=642074 RepID=A0ABD0Y398_9HEMI